MRVNVEKGAGGAVNLNACPRPYGARGPRRAGCHCDQPVCVVCGFGPHMAAHAPGYGQDLDAPPCRHEYQP